MQLGTILLPFFFIPAFLYPFQHGDFPFADDFLLFILGIIITFSFTTNTWKEKFVLQAFFQKKNILKQLCFT